MPDIFYWYRNSYRRQRIDAWLARHAGLFHGVVLDIGGRDRGAFVKPKAAVTNWIFADIDPSHTPDIVLDVADMGEVADVSVDVVLAAELFEHIERPTQGLTECYRVLRPGGTLIISVPFLYPIHGDPHDVQRWTEYTWRRQLAKAGFEIVELTVLGRFFTVGGDMVRDIVKSAPRILRPVGVSVLVFFNFLQSLDDTWIQRRPRLSRYHGGYGIIARR